MWTHSPVSWFNLISSNNLVSCALVNAHALKQTSVNFSTGIHLLSVKSPKLSARITITGMPAYTHTHLFLLTAKYTHKEHKQYKLMQVYTNELMHHFQKDGHVSCTYAHWQNLTNVKGKNNTNLPPSLPSVLPSFHPLQAKSSSISLHPWAQIIAVLHQPLTTPCQTLSAA